MTKMTKTQFSFLLLTLFVVLYLLPLGARPLFVQDETRYAEVPREIIATGDWVVPHGDGLRYFEKPVMGYWLSAAAIMALGENNFAVRLPSALSSGLMALMILLLCGSVTKWRNTMPWLAALVFLTSFAVASIGTFAVLDNALNLFLTGTLICFFLATEQEPGSRRERFLLLVSGLLVGCAFLIKGFLAFALPVLTVTPYLLSQGRWRDLFRMVWLPVAGAALVSLPWSFMIQVREPDFWHYFFWNENVRRFLSDSA
ncbi:MAG TPA: phospholipid carrier-dependent glycosyltransferase, partial [Desulfobacteraceae bacterium]|nr:phospholipid carrier-dependent glycosyltransferase [Desulfobacteraceae bacterium]